MKLHFICALPLFACLLIVLQGGVPASDAPSKLEQGFACVVATLTDLIGVDDRLPPQTPL